MMRQTQSQENVPKTGIILYGQHCGLRQPKTFGRSLGVVAVDRYNRVCFKDFVADGFIVDSSADQSGCGLTDLKANNEIITVSYGNCHALKLIYRVVPVTLNGNKGFYRYSLVDFKRLMGKWSQWVSQPTVSVNRRLILDRFDCDPSLHVVVQTLSLSNNDKIRSIRSKVRPGIVQDSVPTQSECGSRPTVHRDGPVWRTRRYDELSIAMLHPAGLNLDDDRVWRSKSSLQNVYVLFLNSLGDPANLLFRFPVSLYLLSDEVDQRSPFGLSMFAVFFKSKVTLLPPILNSERDPRVIAVLYESFRRLRVRKCDKVWVGDIRHKDYYRRWPTLREWRETPLTTVNLQAGEYEMGASWISVSTTGILDKLARHTCDTCDLIRHELVACETWTALDTTPHCYLYDSTHGNRYNGTEDTKAKLYETVCNKQVRFQSLTHAWASHSETLSDYDSGSCRLFDNLDVHQLEAGAMLPWIADDVDRKRRRGRVDFRKERLSAATKVLIKNPERSLAGNLVTVDVALGGRKGGVRALVDTEARETVGYLFSDLRGSTRTVHEASSNEPPPSPPVGYNQLEDDLLAVGVHVYPVAQEKLYDALAILEHHMSTAHGDKSFSTSYVNAFAWTSAAACHHLGLNDHDVSTFTVPCCGGFVHHKQWPYDKRWFTHECGTPHRLVDVGQQCESNGD